MVSSGAIVSASDVTVQTISGAEYDLRRTAILGVGYGSFCFAPIVHSVTCMWARLLPSTSLPHVAFKAAVDCLTSFPVNVSAMIALQVVAGKRELSLKLSEDVSAAISQKLWPAVSAGWLLWPPVIMMNYKLVPLRYQVLFPNCVSFWWNTFMIW
eukprot:CAMPEP_0197677796 /NCGR_PEP_ID=MMETSP1338-20131121/88972_1 /TAXON_ID=43686 ORGANISM="Pelagodinium beii, Strain RCC1491" /NCGR_SAMPLE_ID=MMETSP1338 /ASSEMBLY_ACC=CAM_ASM_000754 /LENGTH=154 /DNA_ID=CAMNT_0043258661 /DNA_START=110 /DNA_END=571 /DNA_ORIENTATION=-